MSEPEVILWTRLRGRGGDRPTFRRQHPVGPFILDFYCPSLRFAVEVDGSTHWDEEKQARDAARDTWLGKQGISVMRVPASSVYGRIGDVMDAIWWRVEALQGRLSPSTTRSSLRSAGGPPPAAARGR